MNSISNMLSMGLAKSNETAVVLTTGTLTVAAVQMNPPGPEGDEVPLDTGDLDMDVANILDMAGMDLETISPSEFLNVRYSSRDDALSEFLYSAEYMPRP